MALYPCAYSMTFNVTGDRLNAILNQRSQDMLTANNWNVCQYAVLVHMFAQCERAAARASWCTSSPTRTSTTGTCPLSSGYLRTRSIAAPQLVIDPEVQDFYAFTRDSFSLPGYRYTELDEKIPVAV